MQFFHMREDDSKNWHNYLVIQTSKDEFQGLKTRFETQTPKLAYSALIRGGHPYIVFEYGAAVCLSEAFGSGDTLGDKLSVGDIVTVILTDKPQDQLFAHSEGGLKLNFNLEDVIAYPFTYTKEMEQIYEVYKHHTKMQDGNRKIEIKKSRLTFR